MLARRLRVGFLDASLAVELAEKVATIMQKELRWNAKRKTLEINKFRNYMRTMGSNEAISRSEFNALEIVALRSFWDSVDSDRNDSVTFAQLLTKLDSLQITHNSQMLARAFEEVAQTDEGVRSDSIDFAKFLDLLFIARQHTKKVNKEDLLAQSLVSAGSSTGSGKKIHVVRSGGGV